MMYFLYNNIMKSDKKYSFTLVTILKEFLSNLNLERGFLKTLIDLITRPNKVIISYIENRRDIYFSPSRLLITIISLIAIYSSIFGLDNTGVPVDNFKDYGKTTSFLLQFLYETPILYSFLAIIPLSILLRLVFWNSNRNLAMHLVANIYLIITLVVSFLIVAEIIEILFVHKIIPEFYEMTVFLCMLFIVLFYYFRSYMKFLDGISIFSFLKLFFIVIFLLLSFFEGSRYLLNDMGKWRMKWKVVYYVLGTPVALYIILFFINKSRIYIKNNRIKKDLN